MSLSLCMIVRDNEGTLRPCLESIAPWVDELIVVDTGSIDSTPRIAAEYGARVHYFPWCDDFSAARNESLKHGGGEWLFWMDSDDTIDAENGRRLRNLADGVHASDTLAYVMQVKCPGASRAEETVVDHVKLFRNHPELRFEFRIHEQVLPAIRRLGGNVAWTDIFVTHSGSDQSPAGRQRKYERDLRILRRELEDRGEHPFVLFNLGMTFADMDDHDGAVDFLHRCIDVSQEGESHLRKAYAILVGSLMKKGETDKALSTCEAGLTLFAHDRELHFRRGIVLHEMQRHDEAIAAYRKAMDSTEERHFSSVDPGIYGHKARHNLAVVYRDIGRFDLAEMQWRLAIESQPDFEPLWRGLVRGLIETGKVAAAEVELETMANRGLSATCLLRAELAERRGKLTEAEAAFREAVSLDDDDAFASWCRFLFHHGSQDEARSALEELVTRNPTDGAARHNLGLLNARMEDWAQAVEQFEVSLVHRPDSPHTRHELKHAQEMLGRSK